MNKLIKKLIVAAAICVACLTGCKTLNDQESESRFNTILYVVETGTSFSVKTYLRAVNNDSKAITYIDVTATVINDAITSGMISPELFRVYVLNNLDDKVPAPYNSAIVGVLELSVKGYNSFYAANVNDKIATNVKATRVLKAIVNGLRSGIDPVGNDIRLDENPLLTFNEYKL